MTEPDELPSKLLKWLESQGYPLEMRTAAAFRATSFAARCAYVYEDPESKDFRDIDVLATREMSVDGVTVRLSLAIECKVCKHPWILFSQKGIRLRHEASVALRAASLPLNMMLYALANDDRISKSALLGRPNNHGYLLTEALTSGADHAFSATMSAGKAALARIRETDSAFLQKRTLEISFPVVVLQGRLFRCELGDSGQPELTEIDHGTLQWQRSKAPGRTEDSMASFLGLMDIVTESGLANYVAQTVESSTGVMQALLEQARTIKISEPEGESDAEN